MYHCEADPTKSSLHSWAEIFLPWPMLARKGGSKQRTLLNARQKLQNKEKQKCSYNVLTLLTYIQDARKILPDQ